MLDSFISAFLLILLVLDPLGNAVPFKTLTLGFPEKRRRWIVLRECLAGSGVLLIFALCGTFFLRYTGVTPGTLGITGGVLLFLIGLKMLFQGNCGMETVSEQGKQEPFLVPMAVPLFAGPSSIALTVLNAAPGSASRWEWIGGMLAACAVSTLFLYYSDVILRRIGEAAVEALARLMGLALTAMAVQMILDGFRRYWLELPH